MEDNALKSCYSRRFALFCCVTVAWMTVIFLLSSQNGNESSGLSGYLVRLLCGMVGCDPSPYVFSVMSLIVRKGAHMTEFGILALLWLGTLHSGFPGFQWRYPAAFAAASLYAATDEIHQLFVSDRAGQVTDWMIDSSGALVFLSAAWIISKFLIKRMTK